MLISKIIEFDRQIVCIYFYYIISILYNFRLYGLIFIEIVLQFAWNTLSAGNNFAFTLFLQISKCITSLKITAYAVGCNYRVSNLYIYMDFNIIIQRERIGWPTWVQRIVYFMMFSFVIIVGKQTNKNNFKYHIHTFCCRYVTFDFTM